MMNIHEQYVNIYIESQWPNSLLLYLSSSLTTSIVWQTFYNFILWLQKQVENYFAGLLLNVLHMTLKSKQNTVYKKT